MRRLRHLFSLVFGYRALVVATGYLMVLLVGFVIYAGAQANRAADDRGRADSRRIDRQAGQLSDQAAEIGALQRQLASARHAQGQADARLAAVDEQVRQLGALPVATADPEPSSTPQPTPRATHSPAPRATRTPTPAPRPKPSPTCTRLPIVGTCRPF